MQTFDDKLLCAAGRLIKRYPTVAFGVWNKHDFVEVGRYRVSHDFKDRETVIDNAEHLEAWTAPAHAR